MKFKIGMLFKQKKANSNLGTSKKRFGFELVPKFRQTGGPHKAHRIFRMFKVYAPKFMD